MKVGRKGGVPDAEFIELVRIFGIRETARRLGIDPRCVFQRRKNLEKHYKTAIAAPDNRSLRPKDYPQRVTLRIKEGVVLVGSDAHYWPGPKSLMHKAFVAACKEYKPKAVILNGDVGIRSIQRIPLRTMTKMPAMQSKNYAPAEQTMEKKNENRAGYDYEPMEPQKLYLRRASPRDQVEAVVIIAGKQTVLKLTSKMVAALARDATAFHFSESVSWNEMWDQPFNKPELL